MVQKKTYGSVSQMVSETSDDPSFKEVFEAKLRARRIVKDLMIQRAAHRLSQKEIADKIGCTQSRISKLETTNDADLRLGDLARYADALGLRVNIVLEPKDCTPVTRIKKFAFQIKHELDRLANFAARDHLIARGVSNFLGEAFFNMVNILQESARKLPMRPEDGCPYIAFEICVSEDEGNDDANQLACADEELPRRLTSPQMA
jgi:transcriptional regulator with XRE-family HTH domain